MDCGRGMNALRGLAAGSVLVLGGSAAPAAKNYGNTISDNVLVGNALPGVALHSHAPLQMLNDNVIVGNRISGNGTDGDLGSGLPPMGISISSAVVAVTGTVMPQGPGRLPLLDDEGQRHRRRSLAGLAVRGLGPTLRLGSRHAALSGL
jgi:hypothetical protein